MLDANASHISLTLDGVSTDLQVLSFAGREALNEPFRFDIELVSARPDLKLEELLHSHGFVHRIEQGDSGYTLTRFLY